MSGFSLCEKIALLIDVPGFSLCEKIALLIDVSQGVLSLCEKIALLMDASGGFLSLCETSFSTEKGSIKGENEGRREYLSVLLFSALRSLLCMFISIPSFFTIVFFFFHGNAFRCIYLYESFICPLQVVDH